MVMVERRKSCGRWCEVGEKAVSELAGIADQNNALVMIGVGVRVSGAVQDSEVGEECRMSILSCLTCKMCEARGMREIVGEVE